MTWTSAGDDIIDGADITSTGFCAAGTNGQTNTVVGSAASTYTQFVTTTDTIDCKIAGAAQQQVDSESMQLLLI